LLAALVLTVAAAVGSVRMLAVPAVGIALVLLLVLAIWMPAAYTRDARDVKDGKALRPPGLSTPLRVVTNPLGLRVEPVRVSWIGEAKAAYDFGRGEVMYLGSADGTAVFFDPRNRRTVRVPAGDVVVTRDG
jgi:hypothetical protein